MTQGLGKTGISIVIPNYNGANLLKKNLPSLFLSLNKCGLPYEVIVSDDNSTDTSIEFLTANYPEIIITQTDKNSGFSSNCNNGIQHANYSFCCITNTDVTFTKDYFINALKYFGDTAVFAVKGDIHNYQGDFENIINIERDVRLYFKRGFLRFAHTYDPDNTDFDLQFSLLGCCFICRTDILKSLKGYNEIFSPYYWEDSDLALRAIEQGYSVIYVPECVVYHEISSTISSTQSKTKRQLISRRNKFIFCWLHLKSLKRWVTHLGFIVLSLMTRWLILDWKYYVALTMAVEKFISHNRDNK